jgi:hypothetical protein
MTSTTVTNNVHTAQAPTAELSWDAIMAGQFTTSPARQLFEQTVIARAASAKAALPGEGARIDRGRDLVLANRVIPKADGSFVVHSTSERGKSYPVTDSACTCPDADKAPGGRCKHVLATWIWRKSRSAIAGQPLPQEPPALDGRSQGPASSNGHTAPQEAPGQAIAPQGDSQAAQEAPPSTIAPQPLPEVVKGQDDPQATPQACPLPEAAASMNCYLDIAGYKVQVTLRGSDEHQVLARLEALLKRFPAPPPTATPAATAASTKPAEPQVPEGWCRLHDQQMQHWPGKDGRKAWWSHRLPNGEWCKGR